jgi:hypothetical protein
MASQQVLRALQKSVQLPVVQKFPQLSWHMVSHDPLDVQVEPQLPPEHGLPQ